MTTETEIITFFSHTMLSSFCLCGRVSHANMLVGHRTFIAPWLTVSYTLHSRTWQDARAYLDASGEAQFDLVVAAETLQYLGPLEGVFAGGFKVLKPGGYFAFTVDRRESEDESEGGEEVEGVRNDQVGWRCRCCMRWM